MKSTLARTVVSFALVLGAYWVYTTVAEPLLAESATAPPPSPQSALSSGPGSGVAEQGAPRPWTASLPAPTDRFQRLIEPLFPEGSWERSNARVIKNDQFILLSRDFKTLETGQLHVFPCTIVFQPEGLHETDPSAPEHAAQAASARTWIAQAPEGAVLTFDRPLDDKLMKLGRLQEVFVTGKVTIRGSESHPGAADQVELNTHNVQLTEQRVWTPHEVHFRLGHHFGSGRDLTVHLSAPPGGEVASLPTPFSARVQSIELVHLDQLQVSTPLERTVNSPDGQPRKQITHIPISISSQGHLLVEMLRGVAQISNEVQVSRPRLDDTGLTDHLQCDQLALYFSQPLPQGSGANSNDTELERVVARGAPAVAFTSRPGDLLEHAIYSLQSAKLEMMLDGSQQFRAVGAGRLRGQIAGAAERTAEVSWRGSASWVPSSTGPRITLEQQVRCAVDQLGQLAAERMELQLADTAADRATVAVDKSSLVSDSLHPVHLAAEGYVRVDAQQLQAQVDRLSIAIKQRSGLLPGQPQPLSQPPAEGSPRQAPARRFIVTGAAIELTVLQDGEQTQVDEIVIQDRVRCVEIVGNNEGQGAEVSGDRFELHNIASGAATGAVSGQPVQVRARRTDLRGSIIRFDQAANRIWVDGAGSAMFPLPPDIAARIPGPAATGFISWRKRLDFDGLNLQADGGVELRGPTQLIRCATLQAQLTERLPLDDLETDGGRSNSHELQLATILADGGVLIENRTVADRRAASIDTGHMRSIRIDNRTSDIEGTGPGWIKTVRLGPPPAIGPQAGAEQLSFLRVAFQRRIVGNLRARSMQFEDRIQAVYGPVEDWDQEISPDSRELVQGQVTMHCDRLSLLQMARRGAPQPFLEIQAWGNTVVEGADFMARAHRLSYDQSKDQLILEGDGRTDAQLWREQPGKSRQEMSARKIQYQPQRNKVDIQGAKAIQLRG